MIIETNESIGNAIYTYWSDEWDTFRPWHEFLSELNDKFGFIYLESYDEYGSQTATCEIIDQIKFTAFLLRWT